MTEASPPSFEPLSAPGVGSPFTPDVWTEIAALRRLDPQLNEQICEGEYTFAAPAAADHLLVGAYRRLQPVLAPEAEVVFVFSWLKRGGAEWVGIQLVREAQRRYGPDRVLVLVLDWPVDEARDWLSEHTRLCVVMAEAPELSRGQRASLLLHHLVATRPLLVVNCNSGIGWDLYRDHGSALAERMHLAAFAFCFDYSETGKPIGYPASHLPAALPYLSIVISDNVGFKGDLARLYGLPESWLDKVVAIAQPVELPPPPSFLPRLRGGRRPLVTWASRLCRQKRPELAVEVARLRPDLDVIVYGDLYEPDHYDLADLEGPNLRYGGSFATLRDLPVETFDAFLYTALYDGLPNIVLAAGALGVPVVSALVGGIGEVIDEQTGWPVEDHGSAAAYVEALDSALADPAEAARRAAHLYARVASGHSEAAYRRRIDAIGLLPPPHP